MNTAFLKSFEALQQVYGSGSFSTPALNDALTCCKAKDRALITKIVYGVLDNDIKLNYIVGCHVKKMPKGDTLIFLKIGVYCLTELSIPTYAVVNDVAELAKLSEDKRIVGFVNATLKSVAKSVAENKIKYPDDEIQRLSVMYSYPEWALRKLVKDYGKEIALRIISAKPDTSTVVRFTQPTTQAQAEEKFGCDCLPTVFPDVFRVQGKITRPDQSFTVQSLSSMAIARICANFAPKNMIDCCSAPGGKAVYVKQLLPNTNITACDVYPHRVQLIDSYAKRMQVSLNTCVADSTVFDPDKQEKFDLVLCDVPCSGFGVLDNHPDIKIFRENKDISELMKLQRAILYNCSKYVAVGGNLVYSTCTVFDNENGQQIRRFLADNDNFSLGKIRLTEFPDVDEQSTHQFLPYDGLQGFFVAVLHRNK